MFDAEQASFVCDFIECLTCSNGAPFKLIDWQRDAVMEFYGEMVGDEADPAGSYIRRYQYLYLEIAKKNGKSELAAALGVYHLYADGEINGEVYVVAADRDNAGIVYAAAKWMVEHSPALLKRSRIVDSTKTIYDTMSGSKLKVLSSEAYSKHGYKPSCVIFDELHAQPNRDLWDVMTFGAGSSRRQPVWIVLTTAGDDPDRHSIGWEIHEKAVAVRDARQLRQVLDQGGDPRDVLSLRRVADEDLPGAIDALLERDLDTWLPILYGITAFYGDDPEDLAQVDIYDEALWYRCNPSLGKHLKIRTLRQEAAEARKSEAAEKLFRWLRLNQWIAVKAVSWLSLTLYDKLQWGPSKMAERVEWLQRLRGLTCYGGVDLSSTTDLTAFVLFFPVQPGLECAVWLPYIWRSSKDLEAAEIRDNAPYRNWERAGFLTICPGDTIDYADVESTIAEAKRTFDLKMVGFDPYLSRTITQRLMPIVPVVEIPQDMKNMSPAMKEVERGMLEHTMRHIHNTCFRWTFGNVRCAVDGNENIKPIKNRSPGRIDPAVALIIAVAVWMIDRNKKPDLSTAMERGGFTL